MSGGECDMNMAGGQSFRWKTMTSACNNAYQSGRPEGAEIAIMIMKQRN